jgi:copper chaperone CopZ
MTNKTFQLETLSCPTCASKIQTMLQKTLGVKEAEVLFVASKAKVEFDENIVSSQQLKKNIARFGYEVLSEK